MVITNLFPLVATNPKVLIATEDRDGPTVLGINNDFYIDKAADRAEFTVCGWGNNALRINNSLRTQDRVLSVIRGVCQPVKCLAITKSGQPSHPLYLPYESELLDF